MTNLSVPSVIFAEDEGGASWYGKLNGGVLLGGDDDGSFNSNGSRWGVKGSTELSEGLSAVYNFEAGLDGATATQTPGNRLSYMGLSGGFGNITMGRLWSATENNAGGWRFLNPWFGSSDTTGRISHAVSYAFNSEMAGFQVDAVMDPKRDSGKTVDEFRFGATIKLGELGKIGFAHANIENQKKPAAMADPFTRKDLPGLATDPNHKTLVIMPGMTTYAPITLMPADDAVDITDGKLTVSKWMRGSSAYDGEAPTDYKVSAYVNSMTGGMMTGKMDGYKQVDNPMLVKVVGNNLDLTATAEHNLNTVFNVSDDGMTYTDKTCVEGTSCETSYHYVAQFQTQSDHDGGQVDTGHTIHSVGDDNKLVVRGPKMVRFHGVDAVSVSAEIEGTAETSTVKSVTPARIRIEGADYEAVGDEEVERIVTGIDVDYEKDTTSTPPMSDPAPKYGLSENHVTLQLGLGAMTGTLGYSEKDSNDPGKKMKEKTTFVGLNGAIGDTGMSWTAYSRSVDNAEFKGKDVNSWGASLSKSLGAGTSAYIDHGNDGSDGATFVGLSVSF